MGLGTGGFVHNIVYSLYIMYILFTRRTLNLCSPLQNRKKRPPLRQARSDGAVSLLYCICISWIDELYREWRQQR